MHTLSKSTFLYGKQCHRRLYFHKFRRDLRLPVDEQQQAIFDKGKNVGLLARELFPGGEDASPPTPFDYAVSVAKTKALIEKGCKIIYEAAFQFNGVLAAMDILVRERGQWKAYEVKGATGVKEVNLWDTALQYHVISGCGIPLKDIAIVHLNNEYVRCGELEIKKLFTISSVLPEVILLQDSVQDEIKSLKKIIKQKKDPETPIGVHCHDPYSCEFIHHCWKNIPNPSVFSISKMRATVKYELFEQGFIKIEDLPEEINLTAYQQLQVNGILHKKNYCDKARLGEFLKTLKYPIYFLDFESMALPIPEFDFSRPYQQIPFQFSIHFLSKRGGTLKHYEFLGDAKADPRPALIKSLLEIIEEKGILLTYNQSFEKRILNELARDVPKYATALGRLKERIHDLMTPFQSGLIYKHRMNGSYSIKEVLPAMVPGFDYSKLDIADGSSASLAYERIQFDPEADKSMLRQQLLDYCKMDTLAMVEILHALEKTVSG